MIKPIPLSLLIHAVEYMECVETGRYGETFSAPVTIENVRLQPIASYRRKTGEREREKPNESFILFFDMTHSRPLVTFREKSKVVFQGKEYSVIRVTPFYGFDNTPHHIEVMLL
ncbi:putative minor capsid protein [Geobacillus kaustophilus]|uniref:putative minor capsid protein n=1 Tax=Geobacillus kaustophilus TaxID=1462 RepID=UPI0005CDA612|nr:putative minor capsid protein [Geobacillus kaustophilus]WJQ02861.1 putative minor capsid protein [Geobacillus stearothermophilus]